MKKIALANPKGEVIKFLARGQRGSSKAVELEIDAKGVFAQDADAELAKERLGNAVVVTDVDAKTAAKDAKAAASSAKAPKAPKPTDDTTDGDDADGEEEDGDEEDSDGEGNDTTEEKKPEAPKRGRGAAK